MFLKYTNNHEYARIVHYKNPKIIFYPSTDLFNAARRYN